MFNNCEVLGVKFSPNWPAPFLSSVSAGPWNPRATGLLVVSLFSVVLELIYFVLILFIAFCVKANCFVVILRPCK